jgi:hypothetical protein
VGAMRVTTGLFLIAALVTAQAGAKVFDVGPVIGFDSVPVRITYGGFSSVSFNNITVALRGSYYGEKEIETAEWDYHKLKYFDFGSSVKYFFNSSNSGKPRVAMGLEYLYSKKTVDDNAFLWEEKYVKLNHRFLILSGVRMDALDNYVGPPLLFYGGAGVTIVRQRGIYIESSEGWYYYKEEPLNDVGTSLDFLVGFELKSYFKKHIGLVSTGEALFRFKTGEGPSMKYHSPFEFRVNVGPVFCM